MKSQTSFFNRAYFISNLKRYGVYSLLFFLVSAAIGNLGIMVNAVRVRNDGSVDMIDTMFSNPWDIAMAYIVPVLLAVILFRYLMDERPLSTIHAMPVSRKSLYITQLVSFAALYGIPVVANGFIAFLILLAKGLGILEVVTYVLISIGLQLLVAGMVFGFATLMAMLVGSSVLQVALTYIIMGAPFVIVELTRLMLKWTLKGFPGIPGEFPPHHWITPYFSGIFVFTRYTENTNWYIISFIVIVITLVATIGGSYMLYSKRDLERHTDLITFEWAKTILSLILTVMITLAMAGLIGALMGEDKLGAYIGMSLGSLIGFAVTKMIAAKTVSIFRYWKPWLLTVVVFTALLAMVDFDLFGYERHIPDPEDVHFVYYNDDGWLRSISTDAMEESINNYGIDGAMLYERASIETVQRLHASAIDESSAEHRVYDDLILVYVMKNGRKIHREYRMELDAEGIRKVHELPEFKAYYVDGMSDVLYDNREVKVTIYGNNGNSLEIGPEDYQSLLNAYKNDFMKVSYNEEIRYHDWARVEVSMLAREGIGRDGYNEFYKNYTYRLMPSFDFTRQWLVSQGHPELIPTVEDITGVWIERDYSRFVEEPRYETFPYQQAITVKETGMVESLDDREAIEELFALGYDYSRMYDEAYILTFQMQGGSYSVRVVDLPAKYKEMVAW